MRPRDAFHAVTGFVGSLWRQAMFIVRRRLLVGLITVIPIICVILVSTFAINFTFTTFEWLFQADNMRAEEADLIAAGITRDPEMLYFNIGGDVFHVRKTFYDWVGRAFAIFFFVIALYFIGLLSGLFVVRRGIAIGERLLGYIPLVKTVYKGSKQIMETLAIDSQNSLREVVFVQYPRENTWALGYVTGRTTISNTGERFVNLFVPTTPNPTSGFFLMARAEDVRATNLTVEEAVKYIVSAGIVVPNDLQTVPYSEKYTAFHDTEPPRGIPLKPDLATAKVAEAEAVDLGMKTASDDKPDADIALRKTDPSLAQDGDDASKNDPSKPDWNR